MLKITQKQALQRWDTLPFALKEVLFSEEKADMLWRFCESQHLTEDKIYKIATIVGDVILGFIHPEDVAREIKESLNINPSIASLISDEVNRKIFAPIRTDLNKIFAPATTGPAEFAPSTEDIIDLKATRLRVALPEKEKVVEVVPKPPAPPPTKPEAPKTPEEGPVIIHEEMKLKPAEEEGKKSLGGLLGFFARKDKKTEAPKPVTPAPTAVKVELGAEPKKETPPAPKIVGEPPKPRIVHYTEFRTPISPFEGAKVVPEASKAPPAGPVPSTQKSSPELIKPQPFAPGAPVAPVPPKPSNVHQDALPGKMGEIKIPIRTPESISKISPPPIEEIKLPAAPPREAPGALRIEIKSPVTKVDAGAPPPPKPGNVHQDALPGKPTEQKPSVPKPTMPQSSQSKDDTIVDLRTFELLKKNQRPTTEN